MFELGSIGGNKMDAAAALRQPPPVKKPYNNTVKSVMRILRRSHSASHASHTPMEKYLVNPMCNNNDQPPNHDGPHRCNKKDNLLEEPRIVNFVDGLPFVMKNKKKLVSFYSFCMAFKILSFTE